MSKKNFSRKLSLNRETLRTLSGEKLTEVVGGDIIRSSLIGCSAACSQGTCSSCVIYCGPLR